MSLSFVNCDLKLCQHSSPHGSSSQFLRNVGISTSMHKDCMQYVIKITPECIDTIES